VESCWVSLCEKPEEFLHFRLPLSPTTGIIAGPCFLTCDILSSIELKRWVFCTFPPPRPCLIFLLREFSYPHLIQPKGIPVFFSLPWLFQISPGFLSSMVVLLTFRHFSEEWLIYKHMDPLYTSFIIPVIARGQVIACRRLLSRFGSRPRIEVGTSSASLVTLLFSIRPLSRGIL